VSTHSRHTGGRENLRLARSFPPEALQPSGTMTRLQGKTVLITGASAGIGEACARAFASLQANLILLARRKERLARLEEELEAEHQITVDTYGLDVRDRDAVDAFARELQSKKTIPDILVNNAGKALGMDLFHKALLEDWEEMIDTNVKGLLYMTRAILPLMVERNSGHVVNIGSIAGHQVYQKGAVYNASKFAVKALNEGMALDLLGTDIRVSSIDPGLVETEFSEVRFHGDTERAETVYQGYQPLRGEDIADLVTFVTTRPQHVNVLDMVVLPTAQRSAHMVHKETPEE